MNHRILCFAVGFASAVVLGLCLVGTTGSQPRPEQKAPVHAVPPDDGKLRILCFGAHPDDCELRAAGVALLWAAKGYHVKFVSVTNGDIGHWREAGAPLARRFACSGAWLLA